MSEHVASDTSPTILIAVDRQLVEQLLPGAIAEAEERAQGFTDGWERRAWVAGRLGVQLEPVLPALDRSAEAPPVPGAARRPP